MTRIMGFLAVIGAALILTTPAWAVPTLSVTANHLGGGVIQYTLTGNNDLGGSAAVQVTAVGVGGPIVQGLSTFGATVEAGAPDGGADSLAQALAADAIGAAFGLPFETYNAFNGDGGLDPGGNGGSVWDSWYDHSVLATANPPFNQAPTTDGIRGGNIGSNQFSSSSASGGASGAVFPIGQIVINDESAAGLPLGPQPVGTLSGFAQMDIIDVFNVGALNLPGVSVIAAAGQQFSITGSFFVVPEPSSMALLGIGLIAFVAFIRRRR